jgi:biopolymer transport protein ExbD
MANKRILDEGLEVDMGRVITPMLDVAFQIFAFFIVTFHPSELEGQLLLNLPDAAQAKAKTIEASKPDESMIGDLELPSEITVIVRTPHGATIDGTISQISVQERQGTKDIPNEEELRKYLKQAREGLSNRNDIRLQADSALKYEYVMRIMDLCTRAGFRNVGFAPPPDLGAPGQ